MSVPKNQYYRRVYFLMMLPPEALSNVHEHLKRVWNTDVEIPVYIGKHNKVGPALYHLSGGSTLSTFCSESGLAAVHVHDIDCDQEKEMQEVTECWYQGSVKR